jgi:tetratricopeptide (TPR) repeat protein
VNDKFVLNYKYNLMTTKEYGSGKLKYALDSGCQKGFGIHTQVTNVELWELGDAAQLSITQTAVATSIPQMDENTRSGIQLYQNGKFQEAVDAISKAVTVNPQYALSDGYIYRGRAYYSLEKYDLALPDFNQAIKLDPDVEKAYLYRGYVYAKQKQPDLAMADYNQAIKLDAYDVWTYRSRALIYISQKSYDKALADYNKAIAIDSNYATAYNNRCYVLAQLKRYQNALVDCDKALAQEPNNAEFLDTRALVYKGLGRIKNAIADLERILQLSKDAALIERTNAMLVTLKK